MQGRHLRVRNHRHIQTRGASHCACGAPLKPWSLRSTAADTAELYCNSCHRVHGYIGLATKAYR
jgi:hypothetical protein